MYSWRGRKNKPEQMFEIVMAETFSTSAETKLILKETQLIPSSLNTKKIALGHITVKTVKTKGEKKIF